MTRTPNPTVIDVATVAYPVHAEATAITKPMRHDDPVRRRATHKCRAGKRAVEVACGAGVVPGVTHVPACGKTADAARVIARPGKIGDEGLEARRKVAGDRDTARLGLDGHQAAVTGWGGMSGLVLSTPVRHGARNPMVTIVPVMVRAMISASMSRWRHRDKCHYRYSPKH